MTEEAGTEAASERFFVKYSKPVILHAQIVGKMIHTPSSCEADNGFWIVEKGTCDLTP